MQNISKEFLVALKLNREPAYRICQKADVDPSYLSRAINGIIQVNPSDERIIRVGEILGLQREDCFSERG